MISPNIEEHLINSLADGTGNSYFTYAGRPGIYYIPGYVTVDECNYIVHLCESDIVSAHHTSTLEVDSPSFNCYTWRYSFYQDEILKNICNRLAKLAGCPLDYAEYLEVRRFDNMGFYNKMCDYIAEDDIKSQVGSSYEFPMGAWEVLEPNHKQMSPNGNVIGAVNVTLYEHPTVRFKYKNVSAPPMVPESGMAIINSVATDNVKWDITTNLDNMPFWMIKLRFREFSRTVETGDA